MNISLITQPFILEKLKTEYMLAAEKYIQLIAAIIYNNNKITRAFRRYPQKKEIY